MPPLVDSSGDLPGTLGVRRSGRTRIPGIDDRVAPVTAGFTGDRLPAEVECAREHERHRLESVAELYCLLGVLSKSGVLGVPSTVTLGKTTYQFGRGVRPDRTEAAHCLPGQLLFDGVRPDDILVQKGAAFLENRGLKAVAITSKIRNLFGRTDLTSREQNDADSDVESNIGEMGLKAQFPAVTMLMVKDFGGNPERMEWEDVRHAVGRGYQAFRAASLRAAKLAGEAIPQKIVKYPGRKASYELRRAILKAFEDECRTLTFPDLISRPGFDALLREVVHLAEPAAGGFD